MLSLAFFATIFSASTAYAVDVSIALTAPSSAVSISSSHISFSIEQDRWTDWVGATSRNEFYFNVLQNLAGLAGEPPRFRIGADSEDRTNFQPGLKVTETVFAPPTAATPFPEAESVVVGQAFYQAAQNLPPGTHVTWGVNLKEENLTAAFLEAQAIVEAFEAFPASLDLTLDAVEIGNEADLYVNGGFRPSPFTIAEYVQQWETFAANVSAAAKITPTSATRFWGGAFGGSDHSASGFSPQGLFANGILNSTQGKEISTISQHLYSGSGLNCGLTSTCIQNLMSKAFIRGNLSAFIPDIASVKAQNLDYVMGETNSYFDHGGPNISDSAGAAVWAVDYVFFASQLGISRLYFHEGIGYKYNFVQPITLNINVDTAAPQVAPPHVQPAYYAAIITAEAIGNSGTTSVIELTLNSSTLSGYALYNSGKLSKALFINSQGFFTTTTTSRPSVHLDLGFTSTAGAPTKITVKSLDIAHADDKSGLTWGGQTYETSDGKVSGSVSVEQGTVQGGVDILATQVVLVTFES
ncbi:glycoside hydrolase family 79 protein [Rhodocollybia butyracea]|uniref:Glycoside hydrolase family 79 protein n=1 Tax=Rhodocollybia butyracea TaxID=206335 RepID=A0A9P5PGR3_9AGAR|nr:glycoside hydrolase family 79 protein [Rhodocollybia butyracea]